MGVLGWTYDQTLDTPAFAIKAALAARNKYVNSILTAIFGEPDAPEPEPVAKRNLTPALFDAVFGGRK
jgi:hypothetical protein